MRNLELKKSLDGVERWFDEGGSVSASFKASLEAGGIIAKTLLEVAAAFNGAVECGLDRQALVLLVQAKCKGKTAGGRPLPAQTIDDVLEALLHLHEFVKPVEPRVAKHLAKKLDMGEVENVRPGDPCPKCGGQSLTFYRPKKHATKSTVTCGLCSWSQTA